MTEWKEITLQELLTAREERAARQQKLLRERGGILLSVTLNIPGAVKDKPQYRQALTEGIDRLKAQLPAGSVCYEDRRFLPTGPEAYLCLNGASITAAEAKKLSVGVEEEDGLGRLLDIDVITPDGGISRSDLGLRGRRCLLCDEDAKVCARSQKHPLSALLEEIDRRLDKCL